MLQQHNHRRTEFNCIANCWKEIAPGFDLHVIIVLYIARLGDLYSLPCSVATYLKALTFVNTPCTAFQVLQAVAILQEEVRVCRLGLFRALCGRQKCRSKSGNAQELLMYQNWSKFLSITRLAFSAPSRPYKWACPPPLLL
jgi:hypothetical protein